MIFPEEITEFTECFPVVHCITCSRGVLGDRERGEKQQASGNVHYPSNTTGPLRGYESTVCWLDLCLAHPATAAKGVTTAR